MCFTCDYKWTVYISQHWICIVMGSWLTQGCEMGVPPKDVKLECPKDVKLEFKLTNEP